MKTIRELAYTLYKIDWMRRISADRIMDFVKNYYDDEKIDPDPDISIRDVFDEFGFDGECYVCYDEFIDGEYRDKDYIKTLLNDTEYEEYLRDIDDLNIIK